MRVYNSSQWNDVSPRVWTGSEWVYKQEAPSLPPELIDAVTGGHSSGVSASYDIPMPNHQEGDLLICICGTRNNYDINTPSGWTPVHSNTLTATRLFAFTKKAGPSEPATVTMTATASHKWQAAVISVRNVEHMTSAYSGFDTGPTVVAPGVYAEHDNSIVIKATMASATSRRTFTWAAPMTELTDWGVASFTEQGVSLSTAYAMQLESGVNVPGNVTVNSGSPSMPSITMAFAAKQPTPFILRGSDNFNRPDGPLGDDWLTYGGGTLNIANQRLNGVGTPSVPLSFAYWHQPMPSPHQKAKAVVQWDGYDPLHSSTGLVVRANPGVDTGVQFAYTRNIMSIYYEDEDNNLNPVPATGTPLYVNISKIPDGSVIELIAEENLYTVILNGASVLLQGTVPLEKRPLSNLYLGGMIQDDSLESGGGGPPGRLDDFEAYSR